MKVKMYMDVYQGWKPEYASATANPNWDKSPTSKRLFFVVEVPDRFVEPPSDFKSQETSYAEEVK